MRRRRGGLEQTSEEEVPHHTIENIIEDSGGPCFESLSQTESVWCVCKIDSVFTLAAGVESNQELQTSLGFLKGCEPSASKEGICQGTGSWGIPPRRPHVHTLANRPNAEQGMLSQQIRVASGRDTGAR
jgi:hypothetical protein